MAFNWGSVIGGAMQGLGNYGAGLGADRRAEEERKRAEDAALQENIRAISMLVAEGKIDSNQAQNLLTMIGQTSGNEMLGQEATETPLPAEARPVGPVSDQPRMITAPGAAPAGGMIPPPQMLDPSQKSPDSPIEWQTSSTMTPPTPPQGGLESLQAPETPDLSLIAGPPSRTPDGARTGANMGGLMRQLEQGAPDTQAMTMQQFLGLDRRTQENVIASGLAPRGVTAPLSAPEQITIGQAKDLRPGARRQRIAEGGVEGLTDPSSLRGEGQNSMQVALGRLQNATTSKELEDAMIALQPYAQRPGPGKALATAQARLDAMKAAEARDQANRLAAGGRGESSGDDVGDADFLPQETDTEFQRIYRSTLAGQTPASRMTELRSVANAIGAINKEFSAQAKSIGTLYGTINNPDIDPTAGVNAIQGIYQFLKGQDDSVVREGEIRLLQSAEGWWPQAKILLSRVLAGTPLSYDDVAKMLSEATVEDLRGLAEVSLENMRAIYGARTAGNIEERAAVWNMPMTDIFKDVDAGMGGGADTGDIGDGFKVEIVGGS